MDEKPRGKDEESIHDLSVEPTQTRAAVVNELENLLRQTLINTSSRFATAIQTAILYLTEPEVETVARANMTIEAVAEDAAKRAYSECIDATNATNNSDRAEHLRTAEKLLEVVNNIKWMRDEPDRAVVELNVHVDGTLN